MVKGNLERRDIYLEYLFYPILLSTIVEWSNTP